MNLRDVDPARWREASADPRALPARAADLVDAVRGVSPLPPEALARIKAGVLTRRPARGAPLVLRLALMTGFVLASVATARGTVILWRRFVAPPARVETPARHVAAKEPGKARVAPIVVEELDDAAPVAPAVVAAPVRAHRAPRRHDPRTTKRPRRPRRRPRTRPSCWRARSRGCARRATRAARSRCSTNISGRSRTA